MSYFDPYSQVNADDYAHVYTYNGDGTLATDTVTIVAYGVSRQWKKTYSYTSGKLSSETAWVLQ